MLKSSKGKSIVEEAVEDAKALRNAAVEAAKNEIVESLMPELRTLIERKISFKNEDQDRLRRGVDDNWPGESHTGFEESKGENSMEKKAKDMDLESVAALFPGISEEEEADGMEQVEGAGMGDDEEVELEASIPTLGEGEEEEEEEEEDHVQEGGEKEEEEMGEEIEISESELRRAYNLALQTEVQVKKGFSDMSGGGELDDAAKDTGIADKKSGEVAWDDVEPPALEKHIPESVKRLVRAGLAENKALRKALSESQAKNRELGSRLIEQNLFNNKVLHVNRLLNKHAALNRNQKKIAIESIDKARSVTEVRAIYEAIDKTYSASNLSEAKNPRKPLANAQKARTSGTPNNKVLRESVDRGGEGAGNDRWKKLAGLLK